MSCTRAARLTNYASGGRRRAGCAAHETAWESGISTAWIRLQDGDLQAWRLGTGG